MPQTRSMSQEVQDLQNGHTQLLMMVDLLRHAREELARKQAEQHQHLLQEMRFLLKGKEPMGISINDGNRESNRQEDHAPVFQPEHPAGIVSGNGEISGNVTHNFQNNSTVEIPHSRPSCLNFPKFNGKDPEGWCFRSTQFFDYFVIPDPQKFIITGFHMEGKALGWYQELRNSNTLTTWPEFLNLLQTRFGQKDRMVEWCPVIGTETIPHSVEYEELPSAQQKIEDNHPLFQELPQPSRLGLVVPDYVVVQKFQDRNGFCQDKEKVFDGLLELKLELRSAIFWASHWWVFRIRWKLQKFHKAAIASWRVFGSQYLKEDEMDVVALKHRWRWKLAAEEGNYREALVSNWDISNWCMMLVPT